MESFVCNLCNHPFISKFSLDRHQQKKNKCNNITEFKCNKCNKYFAQKKNLLQHIENSNCKIIVTQPIVNNNNLIIKNNSNVALYDILVLNITNEEKLKLIKVINNKLIDQNIIDILNSDLPNNSKVTLLNSKNTPAPNIDMDYININNHNNELDDSNLISYIYLIQEREHVLNNNNIYKFGKTTQIQDNKINRLMRYKKESRILLVLECSNNKVLEYESLIRKEFRRNFLPHTDGHEHFEGDYKNMIKIIFSIVNEDIE
jgi:hypothetical protein